MRNRLGVVVFTLGMTACSDGAPAQPQSPPENGTSGSAGTTPTFGGTGGFGGTAGLPGGGAAGQAGSGMNPPPSGGCSLNTGYPGDDQCILPPPPDKGFQVHIGPSNYANPER